MAMNPCPCGYLGGPSGRCRCTREQVARYRACIPGPLLDRIDLHVEVPRLPPDQLGTASANDAETSTRVRSRVEAARERQLTRAGKPNQALEPREIERICPLDETCRRLMNQALTRLGLSARAYHRVVKVARTIADLAGSEGIGALHLSEAIGYRRLDRASGGV